MIARLRSARDQSGYALLAVLVAIGVFSIIVMALLDLVGTDSSTTGSARDTASLRRASDGALQAGIAQLKATSRARLMATSDPCAGVAAAPVVAPATPKTTVHIEGRDVDVDCIVPPDTRPTSLPSSGDGSTVLTLLRDWNIGAQFPPGMGDNSFGATVQNLVVSAGGTTADNPGLINIGGQPLKIYGGVNVRQWALSSVPQAVGPGIDVTGTYREGDPQAAVCGSAEVFFGLFNPPRTGKAKATTGPTCNAGRDNVTPLAGPNITAPAATTVAGAVPACVATGGVVTIPPGAYNATQVGQLNQLFGGGCPGVTFWFAPGQYFFNAAADTTIGALYLNDSTSNFVFGAKAWSTPGKAPASAFPEACDRTVDGVTVVLGSTTSIIHKQGAVSMCGRMNGTTPVPVLSQLPAATFPPVTLPEVKWFTEPTTVAAGDGFAPGSANAIAAKNVGASVAAEVPTFLPAGGKPYDGSENATRLTSDETCTTFCGRQYLLTGFDSPASPGSDRPISSAVLQIRASGKDIGPGSLTDPTYKTRTQVYFTRADNATCMVEGGYPSSMSTPLPINLLSNTCVGVIRTQQDLEHGAIKVYFLLDPDPTKCVPSWTPWAGFQCITTLKLSVDYMWIESTVAALTVPGGESPQPPPLSMQIDAAAGRTFNVFGRVYLPRAQIDVKWNGSPSVPVPYEDPIFVGDVVARGMISSTPDEYGRHVGPLASRLLVPTSRNVLLRATVGGRLVATATVTVQDLDATGTGIDPANHLDVKDWRYCNVPSTPTATC